MSQASEAVKLPGWPLAAGQPGPHETQRHSRGAHVLTQCRPVLPPYYLLSLRGCTRHCSTDGHILSEASLNALPTAQDLTDTPTWDGDESHCAHLVELLRESSRQTSLPEASGGLPPVGPQAHQQLNLVPACRCRRDCFKQIGKHCPLQQTRWVRSRLKQWVHATSEDSTCNAETCRVACCITGNGMSTSYKC